MPSIVIGARLGIGVRSGNRGSPRNRVRSRNKGLLLGIEVRHQKLDRCALGIYIVLGVFRIYSKH